MLNNTTPPHNDNLLPAISIIIPVYNAEKYIAQCIGSILTQTFQNYEVIAVDDCSTDNSIKVMENFISKFNGRLHIVKRNKSSGNPAIPRNIGIGFARGKYIAFIDNDDLFVNNALENMYKSAEETNADVIHAEKWLEPANSNTTIIDVNTKFNLHIADQGVLVDKVTIESNNLSERLIQYCNGRLFWHVWSKLFRRDFLIENNIRFPEVKFGEDTFFCFQCLCLAKKYVRVPYIFNIWRVRNDSLSHKEGATEEYIHKYVSFFVYYTKMLNDFMNKQDFFIQHNEYKYMVINFFVNVHARGYLMDIYTKHNPAEIDEFIRKELLTENSLTLSTYLFHAFNIFQLNHINLLKQNEILKRRIEELQRKLN